MAKELNKAQTLMNKLIKSSKIEGAERLVDSTILNEKKPAPTRVKLINVALSGKIDGGVPGCGGCVIIPVPPPIICLDPP